MRTPIIGGNWKMYKIREEATKIVVELRDQIEDVKDVEIVVFPPFTLLETVGEILQGSKVGLGAQNMFWKEEGAYTGEISPRMLVDLGCQYVILGHSERRGYFTESNEMVNKKLQAALKFNLTPLICVGEKLEERKKGRAKEVVETQIRESLLGIEASEGKKVIVAYEPVWAIGTGETATPEQAEEMHSYIRGILEEIWDASVANLIRIQYGGSVKPENIKELMAKKNIDGALVGGASLDSASFTRIIKLGRD